MCVTQSVLQLYVLQKCVLQQRVCCSSVCILQLYVLQKCVLQQCVYTAAVCAAEVCTAAESVLHVRAVCETVVRQWWGRQRRQVWVCL